MNEEEIKESDGLSGINFGLEQLFEKYGYAFSMKGRESAVSPYSVAYKEYERFILDKDFQKSISDLYLSNLDRHEKSNGLVSANEYVQRNRFLFEEIIYIINMVNVSNEIDELYAMHGINFLIEDKLSFDSVVALYILTVNNSKDVESNSTYMEDEVEFLKLVTSSFFDNFIEVIISGKATRDIFKVLLEKHLGTLRRKQEMLVVKDDYGDIDNSKWNRELSEYLDSKVKPEIETFVEDFDYSIFRNFISFGSYLGDGWVSDTWDDDDWYLDECHVWYGIEYDLIDVFKNILEYELNKKSEIDEVDIKEIDIEKLALPLIEWVG